MELPRHPYRLLDPYYSMKNREFFLRDPATAKLMNNGQARISDGVTPQERETLERELREELSNFVCEGQYADGLLRVMESFLSNISATNQPGAWVSGFYGSGKSHLLKMLGHLWVNTEFASDGVTARSLVPGLPTEVEATLKELDIQGRRAGGLHAALGVLPSGSSESVRLTILGILLRSCGASRTVSPRKVLPLSEEERVLRLDGFQNRSRWKRVQSRTRGPFREPGDPKSTFGIRPHLGE